MRSLQAWLLHHFDFLVDSKDKLLITVIPKLSLQLQWWLHPCNVALGHPFQPLRPELQLTTVPASTFTATGQSQMWVAI